LTVAPSLVAGQTCQVPNFAAPATPFTPDTSLAIRERKRVSQLIPADITRLRLAYQKCRELAASDPSDPRGFLQQAQVHLCYCGDSAEVHKSYFFLPWHRAFLYFHERILGKLIGDMSFALPCWDWDDAANQQLPSIYTAAAANSLFDSKRAVNVPPPIPPPWSTLTQNALRQRTPDAFLGASWIPALGTQGMIESSPHNPVHSWVAGGAAEDMGLTGTAARDPVFYAHHANVDRMWTKWLSQGGGRANHSVSDFLNETWEFFDENKVLVRIKSSDVLNHETQLRYRYDVALPPLTTVAAPTTTMVIPVDTSPGPRTLGLAPTTLTITPDPLQLGALVAARPELGFTVYLEVEGISIPADSSPLVNVFWGSDATVITPVSDPSFVGLISNFATAGAGAHLHPKFNAVFEVTDRVNTLTFGSTISVTLVPTAFAGLPPLTFQVTYDALRLRIVQRS
jgi:polyphenol oxidase